MSIRKEPNGTYTLCYNQRDIVSQKIKRTSKRGFRTLKEAKEFERTLNRNRTDVLFYSLFMEFIKTKDVQDNTLKEQIKMFDNYLSDFKNVFYSDISKPMLLKFRNSLAEKDISPITKNKVIGIIKQTCSYANAIYDLNDYSKVLKNFKLEQKEMQVWSLEQYNKFEDVLKEKYPKYIPFFHTLFWTGMRKGEARALTIDDLDLDKRTIKINKSIRKYNSSLKAPKTPSGVREIKIDAITLGILKPLKENHEKWLFGDYKPLNLNTIDDVFNKCTTLANLPKIRIHDLRHSHATYLINNKANIVAVSKRLGHSDINMTLNTYTHLLKDAENELISIIENSNK